MKKVRYIGGSTQRTLSEEDMAALGHEHPGLWWGEHQPFVEVEDDVAETLLANKAQFALEPEAEDVAEELVSEKSKDELLAEAAALGLEVSKKATKDEIATAIAERQQELDQQAGEAIAAGQPHA